MSIVTKAALKAYFETGDFPTQTQFGNLIDTLYPYEKYSVLTLQSSTNAPTVRVLDNTLGGTVAWTYVSAGKYRATLAGVFTADKTFFVVHNSVLDQRTTVYWESANAFIVEVFTFAGAAANDRITDMSLEVRVYP